MSMDRWRKRAQQAEFEREEQKEIVRILRRELADAKTKLAKRDTAATASSARPKKELP